MPSPENVLCSDRQAFAARYDAVRAGSVARAGPLGPEDQTIQSMPDASPTKWHLAHTTWFFETFVLAPHARGYALFDAAYGYLFNSYYEAEGPRHPRHQRGLLSRPALADIHRYRAHVDAAMRAFIARADAAAWAASAPLIELGFNHEEQHQELMLTDIKHLLSLNPLRPAYARPAPHEARAAGALAWTAFEGGLCEIGDDGAGFAFDNERPRHKAWLEPFRLANRLSTVGEYLAFIEDGGYARPELWLADGWAAAQEQGWTAPLYWRRESAEWAIFTLAGERALNSVEPVSHVSYYEADAFARWAGARLPREAEWEIAARGFWTDAPEGLHPQPAADASRPGQFAGALWQWTQSPYTPYPGFRPAKGAVGEYNGKFMINQMTLRGGACVTPEGHARPTYRNFFPPAARWAFSGIRLAHDL